MSNSPQARDELLRLLSALEDGALEAAGKERLAELLQSDPQARAKYYDSVMLSALLRREGRRAAEVVGTLRVSPKESNTQSAPATMTGRRRTWLLALAVSVILVLALSVGEATGVTQLVPTIVRIATGEGSLVIEVDDPTVSVTLNGEDVTISGAGIHELKLRPGTHKFIATKDGQPLREEVVTIERGGRRIVRVSREVAAGQFRPLATHAGAVWDVAIAGDRALSAGADRWVRVCDLKSGQEVQRFDGHNSVVYALAVSPDGKLAISGSGSYVLNNVAGGAWSVCLWEIETGRELQRLEGSGPGITCVAFSPDGSRALVGAYEGSVRLMDVAKWSELSRISAPRGLWSVCFSPDGSRVLTAGGFKNEANVGLWDLESGSELVRYVGHKFGAWHGIFLPDGRSLLTAGQDETIRRWETDTGKQIGMLRHQGQVTSVDLTADGRFALAGAWVSEGKHSLRLFQLDPPQEVHVFQGPSTPLNDIAVAPDGRSCVAGGSDGSVRLWKLPDGIQPGGSLQSQPR